MKTLKNHMILFDGECPMCNIYTRAFVKTGMLDAQYGRGEYQKEMTACPLIDKQRAVNEIALVNLESGEVTYGVNSVFKVIGNALPLFKPLFALRPFAWLMSKIYAFISYNRRVIIPANEAGNSFAWQPTFKLHYRIAYLLFTWFCTGFMLTAYTKLLAPVIPAGGAYREYIICGGQVFFQGAVISLFARGRIWEYLGNMMTISFAGGLLLMLPLLVNHWVLIPKIYIVSYFMTVAGLMFLEHIRRTKLLGLGYTLTFTWVTYRLLLLAVILGWFGKLYMIL